MNGRRKASSKASQAEGQAQEDQAASDNDAAQEALVEEVAHWKRPHRTVYGPLTGQGPYKHR